ncbi:MAG: GtrA family protein [Alphaproteobacteria bacterium]|nr:GtrA family protein [Alphaproteobacteria bacterium]
MMKEAAAPRVSRFRHIGGFIGAGLAALAVDAAVLTLLTEAGGLSPYVARLFSIMAAMVVSWQINRRVTFAARQPGTLAEFGRFATVSWVAQAVNYGVFAAVLLRWPETWPVAALMAASLVAMFVSYAGFRFGVFHKDC